MDMDYNSTGLKELLLSVRDSLSEGESTVITQGTYTITMLKKSGKGILTCTLHGNKLPFYQIPLCFLKEVLFNYVKEAALK